MQAGAVRPMMISQAQTPHLQHPQLQFDGAHLQRVQLSDGRVMTFDPNNMDEQTRAILDNQQRQDYARIQHQQQQQQQQQQMQQMKMQGQGQAPPGGVGVGVGVGMGAGVGVGVGMPVGGGLGGREVKVAGQRNLGIATQHLQQQQAQMQQQQQQQQQPPLPHALQAQQRPIGMTQNGQQFYLDAQGRPIGLVSGGTPTPGAAPSAGPAPVVGVNAWQQGPLQRVQQFATGPNGQMQQLTPNQHQAMLQNQYNANQLYQQQQQQAQHQQQQQQAQQQQQQHQHQQLLAQQRMSQTPTARPPTAPTPSGQSPAHLQVPPPPLKRTISRAQSRSASPIPPHMRPPTASHPMQTTASLNGPTSGNHPPFLPQRASTLPASSAPPPAPQAQTQPQTQPVHVIPTEANDLFAAGSSRLIPQPAGKRVPVPIPSGSVNSFTKIHPVNPRRIGKMDSISRAKKKESITERLERHIKLTQAHLQEIKDLEVVDNKEEVSKEDQEREQRSKFNELLLDYLERANYSAAAQALRATLHDTKSNDGPSEAMTGDATLVDSTSADVSFEQKESNPGDSGSQASPVKDLSPLKSSHSHSPVTQVPPERDSSTLDGPAHDENDNDNAMANEANETDSLFGPSEKDEVKEHESAGGKTASPMDVEKTSPDHSTRHDASPHAARVEAEDLGYLFHWWSMFAKVQELSRTGNLRPLPLQNATGIATAGIQPTSAMAAQIAYSAPAAAVRASSTDQTSRPGTSASRPQTSVPEPPPTATTAALNAADEIKKMQELQIQQNQANEEMRRSTGGLQAGPEQMQTAQGPRSIAVQNGQQVHMTPEQIQQHFQDTAAAAQSQVQAQAQLYAQQMQQHGDYPSHLQHQFAAAQANGINGGMAAGVRQPGHFVQPDGSVVGGSPSTESGSVMGMKRSAAENSPIDGGSVKKQRQGKRPTPEEHQRQALEVASRAYMPQGIPIQRQTSLGARSLTDAERQYAQSQAAYAARHVANSPSTYNGMSPSQMTAPSPMNLTAQSPSGPYDVGLNGITPTTSASKATKTKKTHSLSVDVEGNMAEPTEMTPTSAGTLPSAKKKSSGKKPGPKTGQGRGKGKNAGNGPGSAKTNNTQDTPPGGGSTAFGIPATPTQQGIGSGQPQELHFSPTVNGAGAQGQDQPQGQGEQMSAEQPGQNSEEVPADQQNQNPNTSQTQQTPTHPTHQSHGSLSAFDDDFLKAFGNYAEGAGQPPVSASAIDFDGFDFDFATANFGGEDNEFMVFNDNGE